MASVEDEANCCSLAEDPSLTVPAPAASLPEGEVGTAGKVLAVGGENGSLSLVDLAGRTVISRAVLGSAVNSCHLAEGRVVAGLQDGRTVEYGGGDLTRVKGEWHDSTSPVLCTRGVAGGWVVVARQDGTVTVYRPAGARVELTGPDTEPVYSVASDQDWLYTGCRDGSVRKYKLELIK